MDVVIVGAGPAGAALAHLLASRGLRVTLLERQLDFGREFRGEVLMPSGIHALEQLGIGGIAGIARCEPTSLEAFANGRSFFRIDAIPDLFDGHAPLAISQPALLERLVAEASRFPGFRLERGATVRELVREGGRVVGVRGRTAEGEREWHGRLVVGSDGRSSVVRRKAGLEPSGRPQLMDVVWCKLPLPREIGDSAPVRAYIGRGHLLFSYRAPDDRMQVAWVIQKGTFGELRSRGVDEWVDAMAEHVSPDYARHFRASRDDITRPFLLDAALDRVTSWSLPGLLLLGDAAHTMSPVGGQGVNVALRDALVAANELVPVFAGGASDLEVDAASHRVEAERLPEIVRIQRFQALPPRLMLNRSWWAEPIRRLIPLLVRTGLAQPLMSRTAGEFVFGVRPVELVV